MNREDVIKLIGAGKEKAQYLPVACLLRSGYGCAGYYNSELNAELGDTIVLLNARLVEFDDPSRRTRAIDDFNDFLEEIVVRFYEGGEEAMSHTSDEYGKSIPLAAIPCEELSVLYPVAQIGKLLERVSRQQDQPRDAKGKARLPRFFDMDQSEIIRVLRTKLW